MATGDEAVVAEILYLKIHSIASYKADPTESSVGRDELLGYYGIGNRLH